MCSQLCNRALLLFLLSLYQVLHFLSFGASVFLRCFVSSLLVVVYLLLFIHIFIVSFFFFFFLSFIHSKVSSLHSRINTLSFSHLVPHFPITTSPLYHFQSRVVVFCCVVCIALQLVNSMVFASLVVFII